jgi:condensin complex subunit 3
LGKLLERLDVVNSKIADEAMKSFFESRPEVLNSFIFNGSPPKEPVLIVDSYWDNLSAESAFLARSFFQFCHTTNNTRHMEDKMPEVTRLAFYIQKYTNAYFESDGEDESKQETEFIIEQLLQIAQVMDFGDEIGRRKMFSLLRSILVLPELPEGLTERVIEIIRRICNGERDFAQVIMEIVYDLHDILNDDVEEAEADTSQDSFVSALSEVVSEVGKKGRKDGPSSKRAMTPEEEDEEEEEARAVKELMINLKCLHIAQCMLQNVQDVSPLTGSLVLTFRGSRRIRTFRIV